MLIKEADRVEQVLARALIKGIEKLQQEVDLDALAAALGSRPKSKKFAKALKVEAALAHPKTIIKDTVVKGGKIFGRSVGQGTRGA